MFATKKIDVDKHVEECLKKINNETERNLRCLSFAKQYFKIERYEDARRYVSTYLSARPNSAEGHCLLGKCLENLGRKEAALQAYTTSLRLDSKQNNLVLKVCELLASDDVEMDQCGATYFCELAQSFDPSNPTIFNLKQRILTIENDDPRDVSNLILKELEMRPTDVKLRVRLLKHLLQHKMVKEAYKHVSDVETKDLSLFHNNLSWYEAVAEVLVKYQRSVSLPNSLDWEFWFLLVSVMDKLVSLSLEEHSENIKPSNEYVNALFNFDQTLAAASSNVGDCPDKHMQREFINHYSAQLCFHMTTLVFKQAQKDLIKYKEASNITLPLLFAAYHSQPPDLQSLWFNHAPENRRNLVRRWRKEAAFRCSQVGHILQAYAKDKKSIIFEKANQFSVGMWREQLFKKLYITRDQQLKMKTSYFLTDQRLLEITMRLPDSTELLQYDEEAQLIFPDSLHHHIWIALNNKLSDLKCTVFDGLQYSVKNLKNCGAETLNVLDVQAFIYAAALCAKFNLENTRLISYYSTDKPPVLPAAITQELGTLNQKTFFKAAYKMYKNEYDSALDQLRLTLVDGIKILRCVDNALDVKLLVILAQTFAERAKNSTKQSEIEFNEARAELYWKAAIPILEKMKNNQAVSYPANKLFNYRSKDMSLTEICTHAEAGKLFNGTQLMKKKEYEKALRVFETLRDPYASFYQAQIYKHMADQQTNQSKESVTSEMRSQNIILLSRARDCLYLTLDRLREPSVDQKHPLNEQLGTEIEKIERLLSRIDPDCTNRNECDGMSDENVSSAGSANEHYVTGYSTHNASYYNGLFTLRSENHNHSTPHRSDLFRREAKPSPERLDAQLRQLTASKDVAVNHILEHNKVMIDTHRILVDVLRSFKEAINNLTSTIEELRSLKQGHDELKDFKKVMIELKASVEELDHFKNISDVVYELKREISDLKKDINKTNQLSEEDIYGLANDYGAEYNLNSNLAAYGSNLYPNYQSRMPGATSLYGAPPLYPGMYPAMPYGYPGIGLPQTAAGLQFGSEQLAGLPAQDYRPISAALSQVQPTMTYGQPLTHTQTLPPTTVAASPISGQILPQTAAQFKDPKVALAATQHLIPSIGGVGLATTPISKPPPVNVVITASDPLPSTKTSTSQPVLSVTIPPQHLKGNIPKSQPHSYQIPLPTSATLTASPSVLSKPPPSISTPSLLSNISPPVYSAITDKTSSGVTLGLQIEKTLEQTFNSSKNESIDRSNVSISSVEEHDPCPDFKPLIPLPDEVPLTTGEENEIVLFAERAKLFRYSSEAKEWRERGVGTIKILRNPETKKIRIIMRRDQVLKICANHFLTKEMTLTPMSKNDRAYVWAAHDYADGEVVLEKLCVKFKTAEEVKRFHDAFEGARKMLEDTTTTVVPKDNVITSKAAEPPKSPSVTTLGGFVFSSVPAFKPKQEQITSAVTQVETPPKASPFATFTFGSTTKTTASFPTFQDKFTPVQKQKESSTPNTSVTSPAAIRSSNDHESEEFVPSAEFKPVIPLPELVEVKTGEEDCDVLFESRAKLLRFCTNGETKEWKEKGVGTIKLLKDNAANTVRLLMRRDQVLKVCCNHKLLKNMEFKMMTNNPKALTWCAKDFSEGVIKPETLAVRFQTEDLANEFLKAVRTAQVTLDENSFIVGASTEKQAKTESPVKPSGFGDKFKPAKGSWECKNCLVVNDGKANYCVACETPKNDSLPPKKNDNDASGAQFSFGVPNIGAVANSWGSAFKPKEGSWECSGCYTRNDADKTHCVSCKTPKDGTVPKKEGVNLDTGGLKFSFGVPQPSKPSGAEQKATPIVTSGLAVPAVTSALKYTFGLPSATTQVTTSTTKATFTFGQTTIPAFGAKADGAGADASFAFTPNANAAPTEKRENTVTEKFIFGSPQKHEFEFTPKSPRRISTGTKDEESDASYAEEECDNIYFKPVIPLPDKIEVKTGEEEEDVLYCHRAKLFRFVSGQWKERGLGDIKILRRRDTGKLRVLMRREQVFKICLNHILTSDIQYLPKDEKTWLFCAPDFSEGELVNEQFCVRFKNAELAQEFMKAVNDALSATSSDAGKKPEPKTEDSDVEIVSETKVTPEEEKEALRLGLPPKFLSYRQLRDCECDQCRKDDEYLKDSLGKEPKTSADEIVKSTTADSSKSVSVTSSTSSIFGTPRDETFSFTSASEASVSSANTLKGLLSKPSLLATSKAPVSGQSPLFSASNTLNVFSSPTGVFDSKSGTVFQTPTTEKSKNETDAFTFGKSSTNIFGGLSTAATTTSASIFASGAMSSKSSGSIFNSGANVFGGGITTGSIFGTSKSTGSIFGTTSTPTSFIFGGNTTTPTTQESVIKTSDSIFGGTSKSESTVALSSPFKTPGSFFGSSSNGSLFGESPIVFGEGTQPNKTIFGGGDNLKSTESPVRPAFCAAPEAKTVNLKEEDAAVLDANNDLSFASLAAKVSAETPPAFAKDKEDNGSTKPFAFLGAGAPVFASLSNESKNKSKADDSTEGAAAEEEYDPHYDPIVPLPDAIVVSTGEEDEEVVFNERAKLFRYDTDKKEWKERGVGQMKILHHPVNNTYRFLLRREQVHKVVLNQLIISDLELQPMKTSDKAWIWGGYNYTEDESALEKLAVKFKNCDLAQNFYKSVQEIVSKVKEIHSEKKIAEQKNTEDPASSTAVCIPTSIQNYGVEDVSSEDQNKDVTHEEEEEEEEEDEDDEDEDDEDEDDDDDDRTVTFTKRCTLSEEIDGKWKVVTLGDLQVYYDPGLYAARICVNNDSGEDVSNTIIGVNTVMNIEKTSCTWRAVEWSSGEVRYRTLKATFSSTAAAQEFHYTYLEGLHYAQEFDVVDEIPEASDETEPRDQ